MSAFVLTSRLALPDRWRQESTVQMPCYNIIVTLMFFQDYAQVYAQDYAIKGYALVNHYKFTF